MITGWMIWESLDWMAHTPASALRKLAPYRGLIFVIIAILLILTLLLGVRLPGLEGLPFGKGVRVAWLAIPLAAWAAVLLIRPGQPDAKRFVLFLVGTGLTLTLVVELVVLVGDIGRMNTVFKFYLQVGTMFAISAAAAFGWTLMALPAWRPAWRLAWQAALVLLVFSATLFPIMATRAKIEDRMATNDPHTLDGMAFMNRSGNVADALKKVHPDLSAGRGALIPSEDCGVIVSLLEEGISRGVRPRPLLIYSALRHARCGDVA